jgi:hypothetical protein
LLDNLKVQFKTALPSGSVVFVFLYYLKENIMDKIRRIIREELTSISKDDNVGLDDWMAIFDYAQEKNLENSELQLNLAQIKEFLQSGETREFILSKISTIILGWSKMNQENK